MGVYRPACPGLVPFSEESRDGIEPPDWPRPRPLCVPARSRAFNVTPIYPFIYRKFPAGSRERRRIDTVACAARIRADLHIPIEMRVQWH